MRPRASRDPHKAYRFIVHSPGGDTEQCKTEDEAIKWAQQEAEEYGGQATIFKLVAVVKMSPPKPTTFDIQWVEE